MALIEDHPMQAYVRAQRAAAAEVIVPMYIPHSETRRWCVGVDLGQAADPTAIAVLEHTKGILDVGNNFERHTGLSVATQTPAEHVDVRHLERLPLGMSYPAIVQHVKDLLARSPLNGDKGAQLVIDQTGVGAAVGDIFEEAGLAPIRVSITAGSEVSCTARDRWHCSKTVLISTVDALLHTGVLRFAAALSEAGAMRDELLDFRRSLTAAGRATYAARTGKHDDMVLAVAIAGVVVEHAAAAAVLGWELLTCRLWR